MRPRGLLGIRRPINILIIVNVLFFILLSLHVQPPDPSILIAGGGVIVLMITSYIIIVKKRMGDQYIFLIISMLVSLGIIMLYRLNPNYGLAQIKWYGLGIVLYFISYILFRVIKGWDKYIYGYIFGSMLLFLITFTLGTNVGGSINWVYIGNFSFQPAEATKIFFVFFIAAYYKLRLSSEEALTFPEREAVLPYNNEVSDSRLQNHNYPDHEQSDKSGSNFEEAEISTENEAVPPKNSADNTVSLNSNHSTSGFYLKDFWRELSRRLKTPNYRELIINKQLIKNKYVFLAIVYLHLFLLLMQRELGMTVLFYVIFISIFYIYEEDYKLLLYNIGALGIILVLSYFMLAHVRVRLVTWVNPWDQISGKGYQITQSLFAIVFMVSGFPFVLSRLSASEFTSTLPNTFSNVSRETTPGRNMTGTSPVISKTVDSTPTSQSPPAIITSALPIKSSITCSALVGLNLPEIFALGAAIGAPDFSISLIAMG